MLVDWDVRVQTDCSPIGKDSESEAGSTAWSNTEACGVTQPATSSRPQAV